MNNQLKLQGATILVTGATGFIGGRLVEYLVSHYRANVRGLVRSYGRAVHIARMPVQLVSGDLLDPDSLKKAAEGCDIVFHCAAGINGEDDVRYRTTADGTRNMLEAALTAKVKRFLHVSTIAVHGPNPGPVVDENTPLVYTHDVYADSKIEAEKLVFRYGNEKALPIVVLRPTIVFGPRSGWTLGPVRNIKRGKLALIEDGSGIANHVYVDDVVQAMLLAATRPEAVGEAFIVSHGTGVTWKEFFGYYARMMRVDLPGLTVKTIDAQRRQLEQLRNPINMGLSFIASPHTQSVVRGFPGVGTVVGLALKALPPRAKQALLTRSAALRELKLNPPTPPSQWSVDFYCAKGICKIDKAQRLLGYQPEFSLDTGMQLTEAWLRHAKVI